MKTLLTVRGTPVVLDEKKGVVSFEAGMTIDADGSPSAYAPPPLRGLDYLANAGHPGNWWGVATDRHGKPYVQDKNDPAPGFYVSTTSYERTAFPNYNPHRYLDSEKVPFIVVPSPLRRLLKPIVLGCRAMVEDLKTGMRIDALVGDFGPATHLGEASIRVAQLLHVPSDPRTGGTDLIRFRYSFWPGEEAEIGGEVFELQPAPP